MKFWIQKAAACLAAVSTITFCATSICAPVSAAWVNNSGNWSYSSGGKNLTGWQKLDGVWYYFNASGIMQTGWQKIDGVWYYMNASGAMQTGWKRIDGKWYLFNGSGAMKTGWALSGGNWYFLGGGGDMKTGWVQTGGKWYYMDQDGKMVTGWATVGGAKYYLSQDGSMVTGTVTIDGKQYTFSSSGALESEQQTTVDSDAMAQEVLSQINLARRKEGLSNLVLSDALCEVAAARAKEQAQMGGISHQRPDGSEWYTILSGYGLPATGCGENLAVNYTSASAVVKAWLESPAHKSNIMNTRYASMGVGYYEKNGNIYWVQLFSTGR